MADGKWAMADGRKRKGRGQPRMDANQHETLKRIGDRKRKGEPRIAAKAEGRRLVRLGSHGWASAFAEAMADKSADESARQGGGKDVEMAVVVTC